VDTVHRQLAHSHTILGASFNERSKCWEETIIEQYMQMSWEHARVCNKHIANMIDTGVAATSLVLND
jgi:hypothetical protein